MRPLDIKSYWRFFLDAMSILLLLICCSCINLRYPAASEPVLLHDDTSLVFGRVQVIEDDVDVTRDFCDPKVFLSSSDTLLSFTLLDLESRSIAMNVVAEDDGSFYWVLPAGSYRVIKILYRTDVDPCLAFTVEGGNKYIYIGNIVIRLGASAQELTDISIEDKYEYECTRVKNKFPRSPYVAEKSLLFTNYDK